MGLSLAPVDLISLDISYSWVYAFFTDGPNKNKQVPLVPQLKVYGNLLVHLPFGLSFGPDIEYVSTQFAGGDTSNVNDPLGAYFLLGARVRFAADKGESRFAFQITAKNLLDTLYAPQVYYDAYYPGDGRSITVSMQYRF
jgi:outer membrane receptor protein involved in Fe transport